MNIANDVFHEYIAYLQYNNPKNTHSFFFEKKA
jgi:hypothetical protein